MKYVLKAGNTGYEVVLTRRQVEHVLTLWGSQYDINECTFYKPLTSPSGYSIIYQLSIPMEETGT